jgi:hypothetical protein
MVDGAEEQRVRGHEQQQPSAWHQHVSEAPQGRGVIGDVLEHVEAEDRVDRLADRDVGRLGLENLDVRNSREALLQQLCELGIGLGRQDPVASGSGESRERPNSCADVENRGAQIRTAALEQPRVVVVGDGHPAKGLVLPG